MSSQSRQRPAKGRIRLELDQRHAQAVHAALSEALHAELITGDRCDDAREVLDELDRRVPGWLETTLGGEAGYLIAAEAVLRALIDAEDGLHRRSSLTQQELVHALGDAKPIGASAADVLERMRRERLITRDEHHGERWFSAARAGRQFLHRDTARDQAWAVRDPLALLDLLYSDGRGGGDAFLPWVQAVGCLVDEDLAPLLDALHRDELVEVPEQVERRRDWLALSGAGLTLARTRWQDASPGRYAFDRPERPPLPYRRRLPISGLTVEGRSHPCGEGEWSPCRPAAWMQRSSKTRLWSTLTRDGVVQWDCRGCDRSFLVYLQAMTRDGQPAYGDPAAAFCNRPMFRPAGYRW